MVLETYVSNSDIIIRFYSDQSLQFLVEKERRTLISKFITKRLIFWQIELTFNERFNRMNK